MTVRNANEISRLPKSGKLTKNSNSIQDVDVLLYPHLNSDQTMVDFLDLLCG